MKYLVVGLGNIGSEYESTRHNAGFAVVDRLADELGGTFVSDRYASVVELKFKGRTLVVIKPSTYMNLSGKAVRYWLDKENIQKENLLVVSDDIAIPLGTLRIRSKGSDGGHNGLKNIDQLTGGGDYARIRMGMGSDFPQGHQIDFVLSRLSPDEQKLFSTAAAEAVEAIKAFCTIGIDRTMNTFNHHNPKAAQ
ncbi:MAG: aminoacyl-tRNA hydrolase [Tidjanibacter sp.]|nr:aminoacyl-tRNA hydrolase [Tidjanibacter sp.]